MKKTATVPSPSLFKARVVYGFVQKLEVVVLGNPQEGKIEKGMCAYVQIGSQSQVGGWEIAELLDMDFINADEDHNFMGLVLKCKDEQDFNLLKSLRVYDEILLIK